MKCGDCLMYEPDENYCRWFKMRAKDCDFGCTLIASFEYERLEDAVKRRDYLDSIDWKEAKTYRVYNRIERDDSMLYIYLNTDTGKYYIKKDNECYGTFRNLDDAKDERDYLVSIDWDYGDMY